MCPAQGTYAFSGSKSVLGSIPQTRIQDTHDFRGGQYIQSMLEQPMTKNGRQLMV